MRKHVIEALKMALGDKLPPSAFKRVRKNSDEDDGVDLPDKPPSVLYHVTALSNLNSIKQKGLEPAIGDITRSAHGDSDNPATPLVYLLDSVASGILQKHGKEALIVTVDPKANDIWFFTGMELAEISGLEGWGDIIDEGDFPIGIETGDYYSEVTVTPLKFYDYKGNELS